MNNLKTRQHYWNTVALPKLMFKKHLREKYALLVQATVNNSVGWSYKELKHKYRISGFQTTISTDVEKKKHAYHQFNIDFPGKEFDQ